MNALKKLLAKIKKLFLLNDVHYINGPETLPPPLSKKEEEKLLSDILIGNGNDVEKARQALITHNLMLMYGKEASNRKQEIDRQHYTIPNQRPKDKHCGKI